MIENRVELPKAKKLKPGIYKVKFNRTVLLKKGHWAFIYRLTKQSK